jgi:hypothetical protein
MTASDRWQHNAESSILRLARAETAHDRLIAALRRDIDELRGRLIAAEQQIRDLKAASHPRRSHPRSSGEYLVRRDTP